MPLRIGELGVRSALSMFLLFGAATTLLAAVAAFQPLRRSPSLRHRRFLILSRVLAASNQSTATTRTPHPTEDRSQNAAAAAFGGGAKRIAVVGGGASGIFAACAAAAAASESTSSPSSSRLPKVQITVLESGTQPLRKVKVSGGGRCNVMHDDSLPVSLYLAGYPRGYRQLRGLYSSVVDNKDKPQKSKASKSSSNQTRRTRRSFFGPRQARRWFEDRGVVLKTEPDGRMFPTTDRSQTVIDCLLTECQQWGVEVRTGVKVSSISRRPANNYHQRTRDDVRAKDDTSSSATLCGSEAFDGRCFDVQVVERASEGSAGKDGASSLPSTATNLEFDAVVLATGSTPRGYALAQSLGHSIIEPVPSLFTFKIPDAIREGGLLCGLAGLSVPHARVSFCAAFPSDNVTASLETTVSGADSTNDQTKEKKSKAKKKKAKPRVIQQEGPLLVTHQGLSGPVVLRLSAFGAVELHKLHYQTSLKVHWAPRLGKTTEDVFNDLWRQASVQPNRLVRTVCPLAVTDATYESPQLTDAPHDSLDSSGVFSVSTTSSTASASTLAATAAPAIPRRLWSSLVEAAALSKKKWAEASKKEVRALASLICETELEVSGRATNKDEFVTAGGIDLDEVDTRTMQSNLCPGLFVCGECTNVDGVTGGFNFMGCWSTGYVAGTSAAAYVLCDDKMDIS